MSCIPVFVSGLKYFIICIIFTSIDKLLFLYFSSYSFFVTYIQYYNYSVQFSSVQSLSRVQLFATPWIAARQASLSITNSHSSLRLTSIESVMLSSHLILCHPLFLLLSIPPIIRVFFQWSCMDVRVWLWRKLRTEELLLLNCGVGEDSWESLGLQ